METRISLSDVLLVNKYAHPIPSTGGDEIFVMIQDVQGILVPVYLESISGNLEPGESFSMRVLLLFTVMLLSFLAS